MGPAGLAIRCLATAPAAGGGGGPFERPPGPRLAGNDGGPLEVEPCGRFMDTSNGVGPAPIGNAGADGGNAIVSAESAL